MYVSEIWQKCDSFNEQLILICSYPSPSGHAVDATCMSALSCDGLYFYINICPVFKQWSHTGDLV